MNRKLFFSAIALLTSLTIHAQQVEVDNRNEKGKIVDGFKVGVWEYYGANKSKELTIDYDQGTLIYLKPDTSKYYVKIDSTWVYKKVDPYPRYIGNYNELYSILASNIRYPVKARNKKVEQTAFLEFEVNKQGHAVNIKVLNDEKGYFTETIINSFKQIPNVWLPANYKGQDVAAKFIVPFHFKWAGGESIIAYDTVALNNLNGVKLGKIIIAASKPH